MSATHELSSAAMGTVVSIQVVGGAQRAIAARIRGALEWFPRVEAACSRFRDDSELRALCRHVGEPVRVSPLLFEVLAFALAVAESSDGAFDPTVGAHMEHRGFTSAWHPGARVHSGIAPDECASWRDVQLSADNQTVLLARPLLLDLGAVAKGMAVDLAARDLHDLEHYAVYAGGDMYLSGRNVDGETWRVGIRHPVQHDELVHTVHVSDRAVCTSGNYEKRTTTGAEHLVNTHAQPHTAALASVTVMAPTAMVADALATAAFVLGEQRGLAFLQEQDVDAIVVTHDLRVLVTDAVRHSMRPAREHVA